MSHKTNPVSTNSMQIIASWVGGYYASVTKNSSFFCSNCTYNILIESENDSAEVLFVVKYEDNVSKVNSDELIFSTLKPYGRHCYFIDIDKKNLNEEIVVQNMVFSGSASLLINPIEMPNNLIGFINSKDINEDVTLIKSN
jgi:hypothetical protein